jgi:hypothetical protein
LSEQQGTPAPAASASIRKAGAARHQQVSTATSITVVSIVTATVLANIAVNSPATLVVDGPLFPSSVGFETASSKSRLQEAHPTLAPRANSQRTRRERQCGFVASVIDTDIDTDTVSTSARPPRPPHPRQQQHKVTTTTTASSTSRHARTAIQLCSGDWHVRGPLRSKSSYQLPDSLASGAWSS